MVIAMAYYAFLDENNVVTEVIRGKDEGEDGIDWEQWYGDFRGQGCKRTSYNTLHGQHMNGKAPFRKNYAAIGYTYDEQRDAFIPPKAYPSWTLDEDMCIYVAPVEKPIDGNIYEWDEEKQQWHVPVIEGINA